MNRSVIKRTLLTLILTLSIQTFCFAENHSIVTPPLRDPFVKTTEEMSGHQMRDLSFSQPPLTELKLTGILQLGNDSRAIFLDSNGRLHQLKIGETLGEKQAKITGIFSDKIVLTTYSNQQAILPTITVLNLP
ncbi:MAG TPA: pilus assembly protein PilP [Gammaproteobacteria bacterium]|nr:pilus assembly protein PilP [Gammaproteobacteria bacterium]